MAGTGRRPFAGERNSKAEALRTLLLLLVEAEEDGNNDPLLDVRRGFLTTLFLGNKTTVSSKQSKNTNRYLDTVAFVALTTKNILGYQKTFFPSFLLSPVS